MRASGEGHGAALAGLAALAVAMGIGRFAFTPILPMMLADGSLDLAGGSALATANYLGYLAGALSAARLHAPPRIVIRGSLLAVAIATLAMAGVPGIVLAAALRFAAGLASAWVLVFVSAWGLERAQGATSGPWFTATLYSGVGIGIFAAGIACALLRGLGAPAAWSVLGVVALAVPLALRGVGASRATAAAPVPPPASMPMPWRVVACYGAFGFAYIVPATYLPAQAQALFGAGITQAAAWPLFGLAAAASPFVATRLGGVRGPRAVWIVAQLVMAAGVAIPALSSSAAAVVASALLVGGTFMVITMAGMQEARRLAGAAARPLMAAMTAAFAAGQIAGPVLVGALARSPLAYSLPLALAAVLLVAGAAALGATRR